MASSKRIAIPVTVSTSSSTTFYLSSSLPTTIPINDRTMFVLQSKPATFSCGGPFASSSCQSEYDGKAESALEAKSSIGGLSGLRRTSSNLSQQLLTNEVCQADATQIEMDITSATSTHVYVKIFVPTGEVGLVDFATAGVAKMFCAHQHGCGHGEWLLVVCTAVDGKEEVLSEHRLTLDGVGTLFFVVDEKFRLVLTEKEFLHMGHCHRRRH